MKHFRALYITGLVMDIPAILILILFATPTVTYEENLTIAPGLETYASLEVGTGGPISGTFESASGNEILFMVLDEDQYADYLANSSHGSRFALVAVNGSYSVDEPDMGRCYVVVEHATAFSSTELVRVTYRLSEIDLGWFGLSMAFFVAGAALVLTAMYNRSRERKQARTSSLKYLDVVFFDDTRKT